MIYVQLCKSFQDAQTIADNTPRVVAIETEYGNDSLGVWHPNVEVALNHHGSNQGNKAPSLSWELFRENTYDNFIVSHIDLDVLFGLLWAGGWLKETQTTIQLSKLVADADVNGFHVVQSYLDDVPKHIKDKYLCIGYLVNSWIINDNGKKSIDISKEVHKLLLKIKDIIIGNPTPHQLKEVNDWLLHQNSAAKRHLKKIVDIGDDARMFIYRAPFSLTTAYILDEEKADVILQYNEQSRSLTLGCFNDEVAQKYFGKNGVIEPLRKFFDKTAGGKTAVGGSPRDIDLQPEVVEAFASFLNREYFNVPEIKQIQ